MLIRGDFAATSLQPNHDSTLIPKYRLGSHLKKEKEKKVYVFASLYFIVVMVVATLELELITLFEKANENENVQITFPFHSIITSGLVKNCKF